MGYRFKIGEKVEVIRTKKVSKDYTNTVGCIGEICERSSYMGMTKYGVKFRNIINPYSGNGSFYYTDRELTNTVIGDDKMNSKYILQGLKGIAQVKFIEGTNTERVYNYLCFDECIEVGDTVVVKSAHHGYGVATITGLITDHYAMGDLATNGDTINREIVSKFDLETYMGRKADRLHRADVDAKRKAIMKAMDKRIEETRSMAFYEKMAETDDEIKTMLDELKAIK